jgi:hypothetical protein
MAQRETQAAGTDGEVAAIEDCFRENMFVQQIQYEFAMAVHVFAVAMIGVDRL